MRQMLVSILMIALLLLAVTSCSSGSNAIVPLATPEMAASSTSHVAQTHLWGYYNVYIDVATQTAEAVPNRQAMFTANVVTFLNGKLANLGFHINSTPVGLGYIDVDIDVSLTHPLPGQPQYNGYDVRGVFMGDGSATLQYNLDLRYPVLGTDQFMLTDSVDGFGGPDGYTRWFNKPEFSTGGMPLFQYTPGKLATPGFNGSATLNAYKYFADGLGKNDDLWNWLNNHANQHGQFSSGATNTRNYYLRFPNTKGITFGYAVLANWEGKAPEFHPSNTPEAVVCNVVDNSNVYYVDSTNKGGNLILDISLFGWSQQPSTVFIESTVLSVPHEFTADEMIPIGGTENYSAYHVEIFADNVTGTENNELWIIAQYNVFDYTNKFGITNLANTDPIAAFFRYNITVGGQPANSRWTRTWGGDGADGWSNDVAVDESGNVYVTGDFMDNVDFDPGPGEDWHNAKGTFAAFLSKFDSSGHFLWARTWGETSSLCIGSGVATDGSGNVYVVGDFSEDIDFDPGPGEDWHGSNDNHPYDVFLSKFDSSGTFLWAQTWGGVDEHNGQDWNDNGCGVSVDDSENVYVLGGFTSALVDFDPGPGEDWHTSNGGWDAFLSKFDSSGTFLWAKTWGGTSMDYSRDVTLDTSGNVCVTGLFGGTVDFDPGIDEDWHIPNGDRDVFLSKFDSSGTFLWVQTWGGSGYDDGFSVTTDSLDNVYVTGCFRETVDFDPGAGTDNHTSNGEDDVFLSKFNSSGTFQWAKTWGGTNSDVGYGVAVDSSSNVYVTGLFMETVDFDPGPGVDNHTSNGIYDSFLNKFDSLGTLLWVKTWGGSALDIGYHVAVDAGGDAYVTGYFMETVDFDPSSGVDNHTSNGDFDVFLSKFLPE